MLTIVWDVDDVLNDLMKSWLVQKWAPEHGGVAIAYETLTENPPHRLLNASESEYLDSLDAFRVSPAAAAMTPNPEILGWLQVHGRRFRHIALTARPAHTVAPLSDWLFRHFGAYFRVFGFVPVRGAGSQPVYDASKSDFLQWLGRGDVFIDDSEANVEAARRIGLRSILYPQPWNRSWNSPVTETLRSIAEMGMAQAK